MNPLVELRGAGVSLGGNPILRDIELTLSPGEVLGIVGPNGSGKTTLLRLMSTLVRLDRGEATVLGATIGTPAMHQNRSKIGLVGHTPTLIPELTVLENLTHIVTLAGLDDTRINRALDAVGLGGTADRRVDAASQGMKRRLEMAILLLRKPQLLLLDEAAAGLDSDATTLVASLAQQTTSRDGAVVMVSHDRSQLVDCTSILTLSGGRLEGAS